MLGALNRIVSRNPDRAIEGWIQTLLPVLLLKASESALKIPQDVEALVSSLESNLPEAALSDGKRDADNAQLNFAAVPKEGKRSAGDTSETLKEAANRLAETPTALADLAVKQLAGLQAILKQFHARPSAANSAPGDHVVLDSVSVQPILDIVRYTIAQVADLNDLPTPSYYDMAAAQAVVAGSEQSVEPTSEAQSAGPVEIVSINDQSLSFAHRLDCCSFLTIRSASMSWARTCRGFTLAISRLAQDVIPYAIISLHLFSLLYRVRI